MRTRTTFLFSAAPVNCACAPHRPSLCISLTTLHSVPQQRVSVDSGSDEEQTVTTRIFRRRLILKVPNSLPGLGARLGRALVWCRLSSWFCGELLMLGVPPFIFFFCFLFFFFFSLCFFYFSFSSSSSSSSSSMYCVQTERVSIWF